MSDGPREQVTLFSDGSCLGNPGPGGWAALLVALKPSAQGGSVRHEKLLSGGAPHTTNNKMELRAVLEGLRALTRPCRVHVVTDSQYVLKGMTEWRFGWEKRGWKTSQNKPVENLELWQELIAAGARHELTWEWVRGHTGHPENERVDAVAQAEALRAVG